MNYRIGQSVQVWHRTCEAWVSGEITDMFRGPITGQWVYVVNGSGYYAHEVREALAVVA